MDTKHNVLIDLKSAEMLEAERKLCGLDSRVRIPPIIQDSVEDGEWTETEVLHEHIRKLGRFMARVKEAKTSR